MGTIYQFNQLTKLEFQVDSSDVLMSLEMVQNNSKNETSFQLSHSDLNKIIGTIQYCNPEIDIFNLLHITRIDENLLVYILNLSAYNLDHSWINRYEFQDKHKEIRA